MTQQNNQLQTTQPRFNSLAKVEMNDLGALAKMFYESGMFSDVTSIAQAGVKILAGAEFSISPFAAMRSIHIIKGKCVLSSEAQASLILNSGKYDFRIIEHDTNHCKIEVFRKYGNEFKSLAIEEFTMEDAKRAGLTANPTWTKFPKNMLYARCVSNVMRFHCADLLRGNTITDDDSRVMDLPEPSDADIKFPAPETTIEAVEGDKGELEAIDAEIIEPEAVDAEIVEPDYPVDEDFTASVELDELRNYANELIAKLTGGEQKEIKKLLKGRQVELMPIDVLREFFLELQTI